MVTRQAAAPATWENTKTPDIPEIVNIVGNSNDTLTTAGKNPNIPGIVDIVGNSNNLTLTTAGKRGVGGAAMFGSLLDVLNILLSSVDRHQYYHYCQLWGFWSGGGCL